MTISYGNDVIPGLDGLGGFQLDHDENRLASYFELQGGDIIEPVPRK